MKEFKTLDGSQILYECGDIVYFTRFDGNKHKYVIDYGIVDYDTYYSMGIDLLTAVDTRLINGIPYNEFKTPTEIKPLPQKGQPYFDMTFTTEINGYKLDNIKIDIEDISCLKDLYDKGLLIRKINYDNTYLSVRLEGKNNYYIIRERLESPIKSYSWSIQQSQRNTVFTDYNLAKDFIDYQNQLLEIERNKTDYELVVDEIDKCIRQFHQLCSDDTYYTDKIKKYILSQKNIDEIEVRLRSGNGIEYEYCFEWKYWENKRWKKITNEDLMYIKED